MKHTDHTPGPWEIANTNAGYQIRMPHPRSPTGMYYGAVVYEEANAVLVAAVPRMLAALKLAYPLVADKAAREEIGALLNEIEPSSPTATETVGK